MQVSNKNLTSNRRLRKIKNEHCGWFNTDRRIIKNTEKNKVLSARQLFKHKNARKYIKDDVMACVPACRMMIYNNQKEWFGFAADLSDMAPDCLGQIFYEQSQGCFQKLPEYLANMSMKQRLVEIKHRYQLNPLKKINLYAEPDEKFLTVSGSNSYQLINTLTNVINEHGGLINYMHKTSYKRPDLVGAIERVGSKYKVAPGQNVLARKGKICPHCGVANLFCQADQPYKPMRTANRSMPLDEVCDDTFEFEDCTWERIDGKLVNNTPIAWRCGLCMADLMYTPVSSMSVQGVDDFFCTTPFLIGGMLDQLKTIGATDFFEEVDSSDQQAIIAHDMNIVKRLLSKMWNGCVMVPTNTDVNDMKRLLSSAPQLTIVRSILSNNSAINVMAELSVLTGLMRSIMGGDEISIAGSLIELKDNGTKYHEPCNMMMVNNGENSTDYHCLGPAGLSKPIHEILCKANKLNGIYAIVPLETGEFKSDKSVVEIDNEFAYWSHNQTNNTLKMNCKTWLALNSDVVQTGNGYHYVLTVNYGQFFKLVLLTSSFATPPTSFTWYHERSTLSVDIPMPVSVDIIDNKLRVGLAIKNYKLNKELFRALCVRNINGEMKFESLSQYAIAFNMRRYTTGKVILKQQNVDFDIIQAHVISCIYVMTLQSARYKIFSNLLTKISSYQIENLIAAMISKLTLPTMNDDVKIDLNWLGNGMALLRQGRVADNMRYLHSSMSSQDKRRCNVFRINDTIPTRKIVKFDQPTKVKDVLWGNSLDILLEEAWMQIKKNFVSDKIRNIRVKPKKKKQFYREPSIMATEPIVQKLPIDNKLDQLLGELSEGQRVSTASIKNTLDATNTEELTETLTTMLDPTLVFMCGDHDGSIHNEEGCYINLPFVKAEMMNFTTENYKIIEKIDLANTEINSCGFEAIRYVSNRDIQLVDFEMLVDQQPPFTSDRLFYAAEALGLNLIIITAMNEQKIACEVLKISDTDRFGTVYYDHPSDASNLGHFSPINIEITGRLDYYLCDPNVADHIRVQFLENRKLLDNMTFCEISGKENLELEITMSLTKPFSKDNAVPVLIGDYKHDVPFISNSSIHDPSKNYYNFELTLEPRLMPYILGSNTNNMANIFKEELTLPSEIPSNLDNLKRLHLIDQTLAIVNCRRELAMGESHLTYFNQTRQLVNNMLQITLPSGYLKPLDEVLIKSGNEIKTVCVVRQTNVGVAFIDDLPTPSKFIVGIHRTSISSCIKYIANLCNSNSNGDKLAMLLANATCVNGFGGTGKSEHIIRNFTKNQLVITNTTVAKENLVNRGLPTSNVMTLERASSVNVERFNHYVVDEANMINYMDLNRIMHHGVESLSLFYDEMQISKFDSINLTGYSNLCLITNYPVNVEKWTTTYRYGPTLCNFLKPLINEIECAAKHDTTVHVNNIAKLDQTWLCNYARDNSIDVILHPYTRECNLLQQMVDSFQFDDNFILSDHVIVRKVHSFQSREADNVMFIQWRENNKPMMLCRNKNYVMSAMTRCKKSAHLVSIGHSELVTDVITACSSVGGQIRINESDSLQNCLRLSPEQTVNILNEKLSDDNLTFVLSGKRITIHKLGTSVGYFENDGTKWVAGSHIPFVRKRLEMSLANPPGTESEMNIDNEEKYDLVNSDKVRALSWVVDMLANSGKLYLGGSLRGTHLKKGSGCPLLCGLSLYCGEKQIMYVTSGWNDIGKRQVHYDRFNNECAVFTSWFNGNKTNTFLDNIYIPCDMELNMMIDRAFTLPIAAMELSLGHTKLSPKTSIDNAAWASTIAAKHNHSTNFRWRSSVRHTMLILERRLSNRITGRTYSIMHYNGARKFSVWSSDDVMADVFNMALSTVKPTMRKKRLIGAADYGMYMSLEDHINNKTEVGRELTKLKFKQDLRLKDSVKKSMSLSNEAYDDYIKQIIDEKMDIAVLKHNATTLSNNHHEVIDSYMLAKYGGVKVGTEIGYIGINQVLCGVMNKHYVQQLTPSSGDVMVIWKSALKHYEAWFNAFTERMRDSLAEKAEHVKSIKTSLNKQQQEEKLKMLNRLKELSNIKLESVNLSKPMKVKIIGSIGQYLQLDEILNMCDTSDDCLIALPINHESNEPVTLNMGLQQKYNWDNMLKCGLIQRNDQKYSFNAIDNILNYTLFNIKKIKTISPRNVAVKEFSNTNVTVKLPTINLNANKSNSALLTIKTVVVNKRIFDRCVNYGLANNANLTKMMSYIRSLLSTYDTSRTGIFPTYYSLIESAQATAMAALCMTKMDRQGMLNLSELLIDLPELTNMTLTMFKMINKDDVMLDTLNGALMRLTNRLGVNVRHLAELMVDMRVKIKSSDVVINWCELDGEQQLESDSDDNSFSSDDSGGDEYPGEDEYEESDSDSSSWTGDEQSFDSQDSSIYRTIADSEDESMTSYHSVNSKIDSINDNSYLANFPAKNILTMTTSDAKSPSNLFNPTNLKITLEKIYKLWNGDHVIGKEKVWIYWQDSDNQVENKIVERCIKSIKNYSSLEVVVLNSHNEQIYVPLELLEFKRYTTVQAWSDIVRMWLLCYYGGVWSDASVFVDINAVDLTKWIDSDYKNGFMFYQKQDGDNLTMDNWFMVCKPGLPIMMDWAKTFMTIIYHGNDPIIAIDDLKKLHGCLPNHFNKNENYLTMHEASKFIETARWSNNFTLLPGFSGPLAWITPNLDFSNHVRRLVDEEYRGIMGMTKLINLSRKILVNMDIKLIDGMFERLSINKLHNEALVLGVGTRGDHITFTELSNKLSEQGISNTLILIGSQVHNKNAINITINVDPLSISNPSNPEDMGKSLAYMSDMLKTLRKQLKGKYFNYFYGNFHVPGLMSIAREVGGCPIHVGGPPLHNELSTCDYFTSTGKWEMAIDSLVNSVLATQRQLDNSFAFTGLVNGMKNLPHWLTTTNMVVQQECMNAASKCVGSLITGDLFDSAQGKLTCASISTKVDLIMLGPSLNKQMILKTISHLSNVERASGIVVIGSALVNICKTKSSKTYSSLKKLYNSIAMVPTMDILSLKGKVKNAVTHGGCNSVDDMIKIGANHMSVGDKYDQQYWTARKNSIDMTTIEAAIQEMHNKPKYNFSTMSAKELLQTNGLPNKFVKSKGKCDYSVVYSPQGAEGCVEKCFLKHIEMHNIIDIVCPIVFANLMTLKEMLAIMALKQLNVRIVESEKVYTQYEFNKNWIYIELMLLPNRNLLHCVLVTIKNKHLINESISDTINLNYRGELFNNRLLSNNELNNVWVEFLKTSKGVEQYYRHDSLRAKFAATTRTKNWTSRALRVKSPVHITESNKIGENFMAVNDNLVTGKLYVVIGYNVSQYAVCCKSGDVSILHTKDNSMNTTVMLLDIGCNLFELISNLDSNALRTNMDVYKPLNVQTRTNLQRMTVNVPYDMVLAGMGDNIIITDFDNRSHDKYDEKKLIENANAVHWICDADVELFLGHIRLTYNKSVRTILWNGKVNTEIVTNTNSSKYIASAIFKYYNMRYATGTSYRAQGLLDIETHEIIEGLFPWCNNANGQKDYVSTVTKTKNEWLEFLDVDLGDWPMLEAVSTTKDETFSIEMSTKGPIEASRLTWVGLTQNKIEQVDAKTLFSLNKCIFLRKPKIGGEAFNNTEKISLGNSKDWWKPIGNEDTILKNIEPDGRMATFGTDKYQFDSVNNWHKNITYENLIMEEKVNDEDVELEMYMENCADHVDHTIVPHTIQNLWINTDLTMDLRQYAPINKGVIRSKENPDAIVETSKFVLNNPCPMESRPVLTKWVFEDHRSITGRLFSKLYLRHKEKVMSPRKMCQKLVDVYFHNTFTPFSEPSQILDVDEFETALWISKRKDGLKIQEELNDLFTTELGVIPLNAINIHLKLESLLKENPIMHWGQHQARAIYWQRKAIAAISSPIFLKAKTRLKESLKPKFVYADGLTPMQLTYKTRQTTGVNWFFENDLSKQDRQTDKPTLDVEMKLYELLGVSRSVLNWWKTMHQVWRFRSRWNKGYAREMRLTGQSTTSLGNLITNMQVHCEFFKRNDGIAKLVLFLGDDMLAMLSKRPTVDWLAKHSKREHNMTSKHYLSQECGLFCCMIAYKNSMGSCDLGPDYTRLKFRFEVTNGVSQATDENITARCQSYACMLGNTEEMRNLKQAKQWTIPLENWYDQTQLVNAISNRYDLNEAIVKGHYSALCEYLTNPIKCEIVFNHYRACKKY